MTSLAANGLPLWRYSVGVASIALVVASLSAAAYYIRRALLPEWFGSHARLAEIVLALGAVFVVLEVLGAVGLFTRGVVFGALFITGALITVLSRRHLRPVSARTDEPRLRREELIVAVLAVAVLAAQATSHVAFAIGKGMTHPDTTIYHMPFVARFISERRFGSLTGLAVEYQRSYPFDAELLHGVAFMAFGRDILSPFINLGWEALALLSAWCVGRRYNAAPIALLGAIVVLGLPALASTQPGQASNDVACGALLLASIALLIQSEGAALPMGVAGLAAGLALGTKLTVAVPVVVLTLAVVLYAIRSRRVEGAALWIAAVLITAGYWFARNWVLFGSPVPWMSVHLGPLSLDARFPTSGRSVMTYVTDGSVWVHEYLPGLANSLGKAWPVVIAMGLAGAAFVAVRGRQFFERAAAIASIAGLIYYPFSPLSADGRGAAFQYTLRYFTPSLLVGFVLLAAVAPLTRVGRRLLLIGLITLVAMNALASHHERMPAWPSSGIVVAIVTAALIVLAGTLAVSGRRIGRRRVAAIAVVAVLAAVVGGWTVQRHYLAHRYANDDLATAPIDAYFRNVHHARVAVFGTHDVFPLFGIDLSNDVSRLDNKSWTECELMRELRDHRFDFVVRMPSLYGLFFLPPRQWLDGRPGVVRVLGAGEESVYRINRAFDPPQCH